MRRHLPGDHDDRDRVAERIGQPGDGIGGAGARRDQHATDLAGRARIAFGGVDRALLVAHQDVLDHLLLEDRVVDRQHRAARIAEDVLHALIGESLDHHFGAGHFLRHRPLHTQLLFPAILESKRGRRAPVSRTAHRRWP